MRSCSKIVPTNGKLPWHCQWFTVASPLAAFRHFARTFRSGIARAHTAPVSSSTTASKTIIATQENHARVRERAKAKTRNRVYTLLVTREYASIRLRNFLPQISLLLRELFTENNLLPSLFSTR